LWEFTDRFGIHEGADLDAVLKRVVWSEIKHFAISAFFRTGWFALDTLRFSNDPLTVVWQVDSSGGEDRASCERLSQKIQDFLACLPNPGESKNEFVPDDLQVNGDSALSSSPETAQESLTDVMLSSVPVAETGPDQRTNDVANGTASLPDFKTKARSWWDMRRAPESIVDWLIVGVATSAITVLVVWLISRSI
jgi:hypothetical protein